MSSEKDELNKQILEQTRQLLPGATDEHTKQMEKTLSEERCRYQDLLSQHLHLEEQHQDLKEEMNLAKVRRTTAASSHLAIDCVTLLMCCFYPFHIQSASQSGHERSNSGYSSNSSELSQSLGSTEDEDDNSPEQVEVLLKDRSITHISSGGLMSYDQQEPCSN